MRQNVTTLECGILTDEQTVELGFFCSTMPYIKVHSSSDLKTALVNCHAKKTTFEDREYVYTFFHEYVHQIQAALLPPLQVRFLLRQWQVFEIYTTAKSRKEGNGGQLLPIEFSDEYKKIEEQCRQFYRYSYTVTDLSGKVSVGINELLECIASILEDRFRGVPLSRPQLYSQVRTAIDKVMGVGVVCDRDLLDICEAVLRIEKPIHGLAFLLERLGGEYSKLKGENFYANVAALLGQNGFNPAKDRNEEIAENIRRLFVSNVYEDMSRNLVRMYGAIKLIYLDGPVFSKLYDGFLQRDDFEIPIWLMVLWVIGGTPPIVNENGRIDQIGYGGQPKEQDQCTIVVESVLRDILSTQDESRCGMMDSCQYAMLHGGAIRPSSNCANKPWLHDAGGNKACPYQAVWCSLGLEGLTLGR